MKYVLIFCLTLMPVHLYASDAKDVNQCIGYLTLYTTEWLKHYHVNQTDRPFRESRFDFLKSRAYVPLDLASGTYLTENTKDGLTVYTNEGSTKIVGRNCQSSSKNIKNRLKDIMDEIYKRDPELKELSDDLKFQDDHKKAILGCRRSGDPILSQAVGNFFPKYNSSEPTIIQ